MLRLGAARTRGRMLQCVLASHAPVRAMGSLGDWWRQFRKEMHEEFQGQPDPPGFRNTSLYDPQQWERIPDDAFRYAIKNTVRQSLFDWWALGQLLLGRNPFSVANGGTEVEEADEGRRGDATARDGQSAAGGAQAASTAGDGASGGSPASPAPLLTRDEAKAMGKQLLQRLGDMSQDEALKAQLAAWGVEGLRTARECLDEFLVGYQEGKNEEVKAFISEEMEREAAFVERLRRVRAAVETELSTAEAHPAQAAGHPTKAAQAVQVQHAASGAAGGAATAPPGDAAAGGSPPAAPVPAAGAPSPAAEK